MFEEMKQNRKTIETLEVLQGNEKETVGRIMVGLNVSE